MNDISLTQAEQIHRLIGDACIAVGLRARYLGTLAYRVKEGTSEAVQPATWAVALRPPDDLEVGGLEPVGEELFRISLAADQALDAAESWEMAVDGTPIRMNIVAVADSGRAFLGPLKTQLGAG